MEFIYYSDNKRTEEPQPLKVLQVYGKHDALIDARIAEFWIREKALPSQEAEFVQQRLNEVLFVILNDNNEIVGVSSGMPVFYEQIKNTFLYFRLFVRPDYRGDNKGVAITLYYASYDLFNELKSFNSVPLVGLLIIYESEHLNKVINYYHSEKYRNQVFVGWTAKNEQIRITYFDDVKMF